MTLEKKLADFMTELMRRVPVYRLACTMESEAATVSRDGIFAGK